MMGAMTAAHLADLLSFLDASPSPYHAVATAASRMEQAEFHEVDERRPWPKEPGRYFVRRGGSLVAWAVGEPGPDLRFRIIGAHTDSPNLRLKPAPDTSGSGFRQLGVEVYGGALYNSWLDRDLGVSGRLTVRIGTDVVDLLVRVDDIGLRVPQLAVHLDREVNTKGLVLNPQVHLTPVWGLTPGKPGEFVALVADRASVPADAVISHDLMLHDLTPARVLGADREFIASARIDNLLSCHSGVASLLQVVEGGDLGDLVPLLCLFDHEEIGSTSAAGAGSSMLPTIIERIVGATGGDRETLAAALARSACASADGAHATHPNYSDRHDAKHHIALDGGPVIKYNANVRYATDGPSAAAFALACERADVAHQHFVMRSDMACGSTIGPTTAARLGVSTVDVGVAQLSMHSAREMCGSADPERFSRALAEFLMGD